MEIVSTICVAAIVAALYKILVPENKFSKQISFLVAGVFLLTAITAFSKAEISLDLSEFEEISESRTDDFQSGVNEQLKAEICEKTEEKIRALLSENKIYPKQVHVIVNISGLYSIDITEIRIVLDENIADAEAVKKLLQSEFPESIEITVDYPELQ